MSTGRALQSLSQWVKQSLTALAQAKSQKAYDATFDAFFARQINITVNGLHVARDIYKQQLFDEHIFEQPAKIDFKGVTEMHDIRVPGVKGDAALVGVYYQATFTRPILVRDTHQQVTVNSSLNLVVSQDPTSHIRKVVALNQISTERVPPPNLHPAPAEPLPAQQAQQV